MYIIDTNCILANPFFYHNFKDCEITIPVCVLEELDKIKSREGDPGFRARQFFRNFKEIEQLGNLMEGIELENGVILKSIENPGGVSGFADDIIIQLATEHPGCKILTNDVSMRVKASSKGASAEMMDGSEMKKLENQYSGVLEIYVEPRKIKKFNDNGHILPEELGIDEIQPNQFVIGYCNESYKKLLGRYCQNKEKIVKLNYSGYAVNGINAMDDRQKFVLEALMTPEIPFVSITGRQGCGKTFLALAAALEQVEGDKYEQVLIGKNTSPIDKWSYQGFTSGDTEEKLITHFGNYTSTLENLMKARGKKSTEGQAILEKMVDKKTLSVLDISSILGSCFADKFIVVDEAQSFDAHAMRSIITRVGQGSKIVLVGDVGQQTVSRLAPDKSGLFVAVEWLKGLGETAHITLEDVHRSSFVEKASKIFDERMFG